MTSAKGLKKSIIVLIIGIIITAVALGSTYYSTTGFLEKYPTSELLYAGETIGPASSTSGLIEIDFDDDFFLGIRTIPPGQNLIMSLVKEGGQEIITAPIGESYFEKLSDIEPGWYKLEIRNFLIFLLTGII